MKRINPACIAAIALASGAALANTQPQQHSSGPAATTTRETTSGYGTSAGQATGTSAGAQSGKRAAAKSGKSNTAQPGAKPAAYALLIVPVQVAANERLNNGCWARVYENPDFGGAHLTIAGPLDIANLEGSVADDWNGADSLVTGSAATVTTYGGENFREQRRSWGPSQRAADLRSGPLEKIESLRVACQA